MYNLPPFGGIARSRFYVDTSGWSVAESPVAVHPYIAPTEGVPDGSVVRKLLFIVPDPAPLPGREGYKDGRSGDHASLHHRLQSTAPPAPG